MGASSRDSEVEAVAAGGGRDGDRSAVALNERAADRQAQAGARDAALVGSTTVWLEDAGAVAR